MKRAPRARHSSWHRFPLQSPIFLCRISPYLLGGTANSYVRVIAVQASTEIELNEHSSERHQTHSKTGVQGVPRAFQFCWKLRCELETKGTQLNNGKAYMTRATFARRFCSNFLVNNSIGTGVRSANFPPGN